MKKILTALIIIFLLAGFFILRKYATEKKIDSSLNNIQDAMLAPVLGTDSNQGNSSEKNNSSGFLSPLDRASERITKKPFGIFITPQNSPVEPERFRGYHTGTDFEVFPEEIDKDVPVKAVCAGKLLFKKYASGYGGVAVESCELAGSPITIIYGHLKLSSISKNVGENLSVGDEIGVLGDANSVETDGERKHLHLGFHKGNDINILGYVQNKASLSDWLNSCDYICK